jgi:hypothetical protein
MQMVWWATTSIGCAIKQCPFVNDGSPGVMSYMASKYAPAGNVQNPAGDFSKYATNVLSGESLLNAAALHFKTVGCQMQMPLSDALLCMKFEHILHTFVGLE